LIVNVQFFYSTLFLQIIFTLISSLCCDIKHTIIHNNKFAENTDVQPTVSSNKITSKQRPTTSAIILGPYGMALTEDYLYTTDLNHACITLCISTSTHVALP